MTAACGGAPVAPDFVPSAPPAAPAGGGGSGGTTAAALVGSWRNVLLVDDRAGPTGDILRITTTWTFDAGGACTREVVTEAIGAGTADRTMVSCTWTASGSTLEVTFASNPAPATFAWTFDTFVPTRLLLGSVPFDRVA